LGEASISRVEAQRNPNPCGEIRSNPPAILVANRAHVSQIEVPVLIVFGNNDTLVWTRQGGGRRGTKLQRFARQEHRLHPEAGHFPMFARTAARFDLTTSAWLSSRFPTS
jgi:pimeloyl-ACP methyl ester carboxylesterase